MGDYYKANQIEQSTITDTAELAGALCLILRKRRVKGVPAYRVLYVGLIRDSESLLVVREMFERIKLEQRGRGRIVTRVGIFSQKNNSGPYGELLETIYRYLAKRIKPQYGKRCWADDRDDVVEEKNCLFAQMAGFEQSHLVLETSGVTFENLGFYTPLRKALDTDQPISPVFNLNTREIGKIHREVDDWLDHLIKVSHDSLEAFCLSEQALDIAESRYGPDHPVTGRYLHLLAFCCVEHCLNQEAEEMFRRQLDIHCKEHGTENLEFAGMIANLANSIRCQCRPKEALPLMRKALAICMKEAGPEAVDTSRYYFNLGLIYDDMGRTGEALKYYRKSWDIMGESPRIAHSDLGKLYLRLTWLCEELGDYVYAAEVHRHWLAKCVETYGISHSLTIHQMHKVADRYLMWEQPLKTAELYREWLDNYEKAECSNFHLQVELIKRLASALFNAHRFSEAETCCTQGLNISLESNLQIPDCQRSALMTLRAKALGKMGKNSEADAAFELAFHEVKDLHDKYNVFKKWLGGLLEFAEGASCESRFCEAVRWLRKAQQLLNKHDEFQDKDLIERTLYKLGSLLQALGRLQEAVDIFHEYLEWLENHLSPEDHHTITPLEKLSWLYRRSGQPEKAYKFQLRIHKVKVICSGVKGRSDFEYFQPIQRPIYLRSIRSIYKKGCKVAEMMVHE